MPAEPASTRGSPSRPSPPSPPSPPCPPPDPPGRAGPAGSAVAPDHADAGHGAADRHDRGHGDQPGRQPVVAALAARGGLLVRAATVAGARPVVLEGEAAVPGLGGPGGDLAGGGDVGRLGAGGRGDALGLLGGTGRVDRGDPHRVGARARVLDRPGVAAVVVDRGQRHGRQLLAAGDDARGGDGGAGRRVPVVLPGHPDDVVDRRAGRVDLLDRDDRVALVRARGGGGAGEEQGEGRHQGGGGEAQSGGHEIGTSKL